MAFAYTTIIETPGGPKQIEELVPGDDVSAGTLANKTLSWTSGSVTFSDGSMAGQNQTMIRIVFGDTSQEIICTPDAVFLLARGDTVRADQLVPGKDSLVGTDGKPVALNVVSVGEFDLGVHAIGVGPQSSKIDGHLIGAMGVVVGDFYLEMSQSRQPQPADQALTPEPPDED